MQGIDIIFSLAILIMSVVVHEVSHGVIALKLGDPTAKNLGRLTLNPIKHLDPVGSVLLPALLVLSKAGFVFGWAKPVPYNPHNLSDQRWGEAKVAAAGPVSNIIVAFIFGMIVRFAPALGIPDTFVEVSMLIVFINLILAIFNLIPIPPLDGSKVLFSLLPYHLRYIQEFLERYWLIFIAILIFFLWGMITPIVYFLFGLFIGMAV